MGIPIPGTDGLYIETGPRDRCHQALHGHIAVHMVMLFSYPLGHQVSGAKQPSSSLRISSIETCPQDLDEVMKYYLIIVHSSRLRTPDGFFLKTNKAKILQYIRKVITPKIPVLSEGCLVACQCPQPSLSWW